MKRHILGVLAATAAAPYLETLLLIAINLSREPSIEDLSYFLPALAHAGTHGLLIIGVPLFCASAAIVFAMNQAGLQSPRSYITSGSIVGIVFVGLVMWRLPASLDEWVALASGVPSGAICGWIYWRIAIKLTPDSSRAMDAA